MHRKFSRYERFLWWLVEKLVIHAENVSEAAWDRLLEANPDHVRAMRAAAEHELLLFAGGEVEHDPDDAPLHWQEVREEKLADATYTKTC